MDKVKTESPGLKALSAIRDAILGAKHSVLTDTLWMLGGDLQSETVVDFIDNEMIRQVDAAEDESERCALLCEELAMIYERGAAKLRAEGTFSTWQLWPIKRIKMTLPRYEAAAKASDAAASSLRTVARGCREGWDPRKARANG